MRWVILLVFLLFGIGVLGGMVGQQLLMPPLPPLSSGEQLVTQVQEVTVSPNTAAAEVVATAQRSVVLLGTQTTAGVQPLGSAAIVTNDGLVASTLRDLTGPVVALDDTGASHPLDRVGEDELYGISYWRIPSTVVVPLDVRREPVAVGSELLALARSEATAKVRVAEYRVQEASLPLPENAPAVQQIVRGSNDLPRFFVGAPLVDDNGRLTGLILNEAGDALSATTLQLSLTRLARGQREVDPFATLGLQVEYIFTTVPTTPDRLSFVSRISTVIPNSSAAEARLQRGDIILSVNDTAIAWEASLAEQLGAALPLRLLVLRGEDTLTVTLAAPPQS